VRIAIGGADSVAPGETVQLSVTAFLSDGTTRVVTADVIWESANSELMTISRTGLVTAADVRGEGQITARYQGGLPANTLEARSISQTLLVIPTGTYVLSGAVTDGGFPISGVTVELTSGSGAGMAMIANPSFKFYGVAGETEIRLTKAGYETQVRRISVTRHETAEFDLVPSGERLAIAGTYTLRIAAAAACQLDLPEPLRTRTYTAVISQTGAQLTAVLSGAHMGGEWNPADTFSGSVEPGIVRFALRGYSGAGTASFIPPTVLEVIPSSDPHPRYFTFFGSVVTTPVGDGYSGTLDGSLELFTVPGPWDADYTFTKLASCRSAGHQFTLTR
jgi:hypothetical protein